MGIKVTFELEDKDLAYFRQAIRRAGQSAKKVSEEDIIARAREMLKEARGAKMPRFVKTHVLRLSTLIDMVTDKDWQLEAKERANAIEALAYFADPEDLIPDEIPVFGYVDDAIMVDLVMDDLKHEVDAFKDFVAYRKAQKAVGKGASTSDWQENRRAALFARMRRRRQRAGSRLFRR